LAEQDNYFYWASYETLRRLALTSLVVVVKIIDTDFSVLYTVLVSFMGVAVQAFFTPFKDDRDDLLSLFFLVNEFLLALTMLCEQHWQGWTGGSVAGIVLVVLTSAALIYALYIAKVVSTMKWVASESVAHFRARDEEELAAASEKHLATDEEVAQPPASPSADAELGSHPLH
jgi:hypothetical protein